MNLYDEEIDGALQDFDTFPEMRDSLTVKDAEFERIACYYNAKAEALEEKKAFFERLVIGFYNYQRAKNPRYQLKTPWGKVVQRRTKSPTWKNESETVEWLKATGRGELVKVEESLKKADLKKAFAVVNGHYVDESTGEIVPGVTVEEKTSVKVSTVEVDNE